MSSKCISDASSPMFKFPRELARIICDYAASNWHFLPWVEALTKTPRISKIIRGEMMQLWKNPRGIDMALSLNLPMAWSQLSANNNPWAVTRLADTRDKIDWEILYGNPGFYLSRRQLQWDPTVGGTVWSDEDIPISKVQIIPLDECPDRIRYTNRLRNAMNPLDEYVDELIEPKHWAGTVHLHTEQIPFACMNPNPRMVGFVISNGNVNDTTAWSNPNGRMLEYLLTRSDPLEHPINWKHFSANSHPTAIEMLQQSPEKINWSEFLSNPGIFVQRVENGVFELLVG